MKLPWHRRRGLADRLRPYVSPAEPSEPMVDADPIRMFLFRWMIETGDPVEVVAKGFDLDEGLVEKVLSGQARRLAPQTAGQIRRQLGIGSTRAAEAIRRHQVTSARPRRLGQPDPR